MDTSRRASRSPRCDRVTCPFLAAARLHARAFAESLVSSLAKLRHIEREGVTPELFESVIFECFDTLGTDGRRVELAPRRRTYGSYSFGRPLLTLHTAISTTKVELEPGGARRAVTWSDRGRYADAVEAFRLREFDAATRAVRRGLAATLPLPLLSLFTGERGAGRRGARSRRAASARRRLRARRADGRTEWRWW